MSASTIAEVFDNRVQRLKIIDHDTRFYENPEANVINKQILVSNNLSEDMTENIFSDISRDVSFVPTCKCGKLTGMFYSGTKCRLCNSKVSTEFSSRLTHSHWIEIPDIFPPIINPLIYDMLRRWSEPVRNASSIIDCILDPKLTVPVDFDPPVKGSGFKYFHDNADVLLDYMLNFYPPTANKKNTLEVKRFLIENKSKLFCRHIPILNQALHPASRSGSMRYIDKSTKEILEIITNLNYTTFIKRKGVVALKATDKALFSILSGYRTYIENLTKVKLGDKLERWPSRG